MFIDIKNEFGIGISLRESNSPGRCDFVEIHRIETKQKAFKEYSRGPPDTSSRLPGETRLTL